MELVGLFIFLLTGAFVMVGGYRLLPFWWAIGVLGFYGLMLAFAVILLFQLFRDHNS